MSSEAPRWAWECKDCDARGSGTFREVGDESTLHAWKSGHLVRGNEVKQRLWARIKCRLGIA